MVKTDPFQTAQAYVQNKNVSGLFQVRMRARARSDALALRAPL